MENVIMCLKLVYAYTTFLSAIQSITEAFSKYSSLF